MVSLVPQGSALLSSLSSHPSVVYLGCHTFNCHLREQHLNTLPYHHVSYLITLYVSRFSSVSRSLLCTQRFHPSLPSQLIALSLSYPGFALLLCL